MSGTAFGKSPGDDRPMKYPGQAQALCFPHSQPPTSNFQFALCFIPLVHLDKWLLKRGFPCLTLLQNDRTSSPTNQKGTVRLSEVSPVGGVARSVSNATAASRPVETAPGQKLPASMCTAATVICPYRGISQYNAGRGFNGWSALCAHCSPTLTSRKDHRSIRNLL